jgi:hypothetical protein
MHTVRRSLLVVLFSLSFASVAHADPHPVSVIRIMNSTLAETLTELHEVSPTARAIVSELDRSDLVIHVMPLPPVRRRLFTGTTHFVTSVGGRRIVRVAVDQTLPDDRRAAALAHELYHALEVARATWVVDRDGFAKLYRSIGHKSGGDQHTECYETPAAVNAGLRARAEFRSAVAASRDRSRASVNGSH